MLPFVMLEDPIILSFLIKLAWSDSKYSYWTKLLFLISMSCNKNKIQQVIKFSVVCLHTTVIFFRVGGCNHGVRFCAIGQFKTNVSNMLHEEQTYLYFIQKWCLVWQCLIKVTVKPINALSGMGHKAKIWIDKWHFFNNIKS